MKPIPLIVALLAGSTLALTAQVANEGVANAIIATRQKDAKLMQQYSWNCRTELQENGEIKDTRIEMVTCGPTGQLQYSQLSNQAAPLPGGFFRHRIAEKEREKMEEYIKGLRAFLHQYTLPSAGQVINFISAAHIPPPDKDGNLQITGSSVVIPSDTMSLWVKASTHQTLRVQIMTYYNGDEINVSATYKTLPGGYTYMAYGQINDPDKNLTLLIQNFDCINQNL
jgi:hypothetical protein